MSERVAPEKIQNIREEKGNTGKQQGKPIRNISKNQGGRNGGREGWRD